MSKFFILVVLILFILSPSAVLANDHKVKAVILVPANKKNLLPQDKEVKIKSAVQQALKRVQKFYADNLFGKTFNLDNNVAIIHSTKNIPGDGFSQYATDFIWKLDALQYLPAKSNTTYVVWTVGGRAPIQAAFLPGMVNGYDGIAALDSGQLFALDQPDNLDNIGMLAHELGHAFGLVDTGFAKFHPCTIGTTHECKDKALQPLPDISEYEDDVMGYNPEKFPDFTIHNSIHNPIVSKAFQSVYLNPTKDPAPKPQVSVSPPKIQRFFPEVAIAEETVVELRGANFGNNQGEVLLIESGNKAEKIKVQNINNWNDSTIKIVVPKEAAKHPDLGTIWSIQVIKSQDKSLATSQHHLLVKDKPLSYLQLPPIPISARLNITCGPDKQPLPNVRLSLVEGQALSKILKETTTDKTGQATIEQTITKATVLSEFYILIEQISGIPPALPRAHRISFDNNQTQFSDLNFSSNFTQCPTENKTPTVAETPSSLEINQVVISNYQDFREVNDPNDKGSITQSEQYQSGKKIDWTASTLTANPQVYVQIIYPNKEPENYSIDVNTEETLTNFAQMELRIKRVLSAEISQGQEKKITKIYLASVSGDYLADLFIDDQYFDPEIDITEQTSQFKIIRCFSDLSCDDPQLAKVLNLSVLEEPPVPPQSVFSHRVCGGNDEQVIVDVYSDGSEVPGSHCPDLDESVSYKCLEFDNEGVKDARCIPREEDQ